MQLSHPTANEVLFKLNEEQALLPLCCLQSCPSPRQNLDCSHVKFRSSERRVGVEERRTGQGIQLDQRCWVSSLYGAVSWPRQGHLTIKSSDSLYEELALPTDWLTDWLGSSEVCTAPYPDLEFTLFSSLPFSSCVAAKANTRRWNTGRHSPEDRLNISINLKQVGLWSKHNNKRLSVCNGTLDISNLHLLLCED